MTEVLDYSLGSTDVYTSITDTIAAAGTVASSDRNGAPELTTRKFSGFTVITEHDKEPLLSIIADSQSAVSGMARFVGCDGPVEDLLFKEGPLKKRQVAGYVLREFLRGEQRPLGLRPIADGDTLKFGATNEGMAQAFRLLAQGALGYSFVLSE